MTADPPGVSTNSDLYVVPIGGGQTRRITATPGADASPRYSPDGKFIAWRAQFRAGYESDRFRLVMYDRKAGQIKNLTEDWDHWVENIAWSPDSKTIYLTSEDKGEIPIYKLEMEKAAAPQEIARGAVS